MGCFCEHTVHVCVRLFSDVLVFAALEGLLNGSNVDRVCEESLLSLAQQSGTVTSAQPRAWSSGRPTAVVESSGQSTSGKHEFAASIMAERARPICSRLLTVMPGSCQPEAAPVAVSSSVAVSSPELSVSCSCAGLHTAGWHSCRVELQPAETSTVESSCRPAKRRRTSPTLELGNVHLRDLLSQDDEDEDEDAAANINSSVAYRSRESPQEPQSTSCDDPPDSSTGSVRCGVPSNSILKQLLTDSDSEEQNDVSASVPETTHSDNESHILLKVCQQL